MSNTANFELIRKKNIYIHIEIHLQREMSPHTHMLFSANECIPLVNVIEYHCFEGCERIKLLAHTTSRKFCLAPILAGTRKQ